MPTKVDGSAMFRAMDGFERALRRISLANGFNTNPKVAVGSHMLDEVKDGQFPFLCFEVGDLQPDVEQTGPDAPAHGTIRFNWPIVVYGYVRESGDRKALYRAGTALFLDVMSALYADETLPDAAGQGTALFIHPGEVAFDMESFAPQNRGWFAATFEVVFDLERSGTP